MENDGVSFYFCNPEKLPLIIEAKDEEVATPQGLKAFIKKYNSAFTNHLLEHGAILFRGFNITTPELFLASIKACSLGELFHYDSCMVPRTKIIEEGIYTSVNLGEHIAVPMHSEKSYDPEFPSHIYFNALHVAEKGGSTLLANASNVWEALPSSLQKKLTEKNILYRKYYYGKSVLHKLIRYIGKGINSTTWMEAFNTEKKSVVEARMKNGTHIWRWVKKGNGLITEITLPASRQHPISNKTVWFNQSDHRNYYYNAFQAMKFYLKNPIAQKIMRFKSLLPYVTFFGDGESISRIEANIIHQAIQKNIARFQWQIGDFLVVDNYLCMHGKEPHIGKRYLLVGMTQKCIITS